MIIERYPGYSEDLERDLPWLGLGALRAIGYWRSEGEPDLPNPTEFVDPSWDATERAVVITYLRAGKAAIGWLGSSWCRFGCGAYRSLDAVAREEVDYYKAKIPEAEIERIARFVFSREVMGSECQTDGVFIWPEGFAHYLEAHAVRPPEEFVRHVLERAQR